MRQNASLVAITATLVVLARASSFAQAPFAVTWGYESSGELGNGLPLSGLSFPGPVSNASGGCCLGQMVDLQGAADALIVSRSLRKDLAFHPFPCPKK